MQRIQSKKLSYLIDPADIDEIFNLYHWLPNQVTINGERVERHTSSMIGDNARVTATPMISFFTEEELGTIWEKARKGLEDEYGMTFEFCRARLLKYTRGCKVPVHNDRPELDEANFSVIIQLNRPVVDYTGGVILIDSLLKKGETGEHLTDYDLLLPGDAITWDYSEPHEISLMKNGIRYVLNFRLKAINK